MERIRNGKFTSFVFLFFFKTTKRISKKFGIKRCTINFEVRHSVTSQGRNMSSAVQSVHRNNCVCTAAAAAVIPLKLYNDVPTG